MEPYISLISGLVGALVGAFSSILTVKIQASYQLKRERTRDALTLAIEDWKTQISLAKDRPGRGTIMPLAAFVHYHTKFIKLAELGQLTPENLKRLHVEQEEISKSFKRSE
jgi:hypothetical protein